MHDVVSRRGFLAGSVATLALTGLPACANAPAQSLRPVLRPAGGLAATVPGAEALVSKAQLGGEVVYALADAETGAMLEARQPQRGLPPASVVKALTAIYALDALGPAHRFETRLLATGPVQNGTLAGDLVLAGGGDPMLDTNGLADMAAKLKAAGVREVRGRFLVWGGALPYASVIDPDQPDHVGYNPAVSGLSLNFNRVHFEWKRNGQGYGVTMDARSDRYRPDVRVARMSIVARDLPVYTYSDAQGIDQWLELYAGLSDPLRQCRTRDSQTRTAKDLLLPVQRQMIGVFGHHDMSQQAGSRDALVDHLGWYRRLINVSHWRQAHLPRTCCSTVNTPGV